MRFSAALVATFAALALAAPMQKRAGVLGTKTYNEYVLTSSRSLRSRESTLPLLVEY
jgi:hypothetical protein